MQVETSTANEPASDGRSKKRPGVEEQRAIILRAAVSLFADKGVAAVSIAQICSYAEISRPTFYRCFEDKAALVSAIYEDSVNTHVETFFVIGRFRNQQQLKASLDALLESIFQRSELALLVFNESNDPSSPAASIVDAAFEHAADVMTKSWGSHANQVPSRVYLKSIMAAVQWIVQDAIRKGLNEATKDDAKDAAYQLVSRVMS
ncbi:MAG: AcrR family transcriptional regulator [Halioglobus sp.]|jgi:AcrR family transcriptional regulator